MKSNTYYFKTNNNISRPFNNFILPHYNDLPTGGKFYVDIVRAFRYEGFLARSGIWSDPWKTVLHPGLEIPPQAENCKLTFDEITDFISISIKNQIQETNKKYVLFYSGGIDSTVCLVSLLKNLSATDLKNITVALSAESIIENPVFYTKFIKDKIQVIDSSQHLYVDLIDKGYTCITADLGDTIFGTELGTKLYPRLKYLNNNLSVNSKKILEKHFYTVSDKEVHYSLYSDVIISYFDSHLPNEKNNFGKFFYEKVIQNIETSDVPIYSLHDFFWWIIFNIKYSFCALRPGMIYSTGKNRKHLFDNENIFNWFGTVDYQHWSLSNNNNGEKIKGNQPNSYKYAARKYIYEFDKNDWYFNHKLKIASLRQIFMRNYRTHFNEFDNLFAMDTDYNVHYYGNPRVDIEVMDGLYNFKKDW
jgi:hypothetical protein